MQDSQYTFVEDGLLHHYCIRSRTVELLYVFPNKSGRVAEHFPRNPVFQAGIGSSLNEVECELVVIENNT